MAKSKQTAITPTRAQDYPEWFQQVIRAADLAEVSPVRGCMVIKPWGYAIWEKMQGILDKMFKDTGHVNAYFPLFIPKSFMEKEAEHVKGFAKECAIVTHHRLESDGKGGLAPAGPLEEPLIIRPTSEMIIGSAYSKWVQSYRDLPILINQWANVVRWEMRTRMFLRTSEFLWQEGHTAHATEEEARRETLQMLDIYETFAEKYMAMPVIKGEKTPDERFPGAVNTYAIEALMQDGKALQAGTSHFLGQNFSKAMSIKFQDKDGEEQHAWTTSWGVSTRLIGGLIMTHSDDDGLVLPPLLAPKHIVILPIYRHEDQKAKILDFCHQVKAELDQTTFSGHPIESWIDDRDLRGGEKVWQHIKKGVPIRLEVGPRDLEATSVTVSRRDRPHKEKTSLNVEGLRQLGTLLETMQSDLFQRALKHRQDRTHFIDNLDDFRSFFTPKNLQKPEIHGGLASAYWHEDPQILDIIKDLKVSIRCVPLKQESDSGVCFFTGKTANKKAIFGKSY